MKEKVVRPLPGAPLALIFVALMGMGIFSITQLATGQLPESFFWVPLVLSGLGVLILFGFFTLQPNESRVLILFGNYKGTVRKAGWHWGNPFYTNSSPSSALKEERARSITTTKSVTGSRPDSRFKISLRARTEVGETIKVNDRRGNPIEIAAVVVWRVSETTKAVFDVDDYRTYVKTQIESALRHVATGFAYDNINSSEISGELTLRGNPEEVAAELRQDLETRLSVAGVTIDDSRLTHLAYAPEIAQAMLRRQQAEAVISARKKIVQGSVGMVELAIADLEKSGAVELNSERKASMVSNLMVVLCSEKDATPVINVGTLYS